MQKGKQFLKSEKMFYLSFWRNTYKSEVCQQCQWLFFFFFYLSIRKSVLQHHGPKWRILQTEALPWRRGFLLPPDSLSWSHWHLKPDMKTMSLLEDDQWVLNCDRGDRCQHCTCNKNHWTAHCKWINYIICKLYLNKAISKKTKTKKPLMNPVIPWKRLSQSPLA